MKLKLTTDQFIGVINESTIIYKNNNIVILHHPVINKIFKVKPITTGHDGTSKFSIKELKFIELKTKKDTIKYNTTQLKNDSGEYEKIWIRRKDFKVFNNFRDLRGVK